MIESSNFNKLIENLEQQIFGWIPEIFILNGELKIEDYTSWEGMNDLLNKATDEIESMRCEGNFDGFFKVEREQLLTLNEDATKFYKLPKEEYKKAFEQELQRLKEKDSESLSDKEMQSKLQLWVKHIESDSIEIPRIVAAIDMQRNLVCRYLMEIKQILPEIDELLKARKEYVDNNNVSITNQIK